MTFEEETLLYCAFKHVLGKEIWQATLVYKELKKRYYELSEEAMAKYVSDIDSYFDGRHLLGQHNESLRRTKWLFEPDRKRVVQYKNKETGEFENVLAVLGDNGDYYSIPYMKELYPVRISE